MIKDKKKLISTLAVYAILLVLFVIVVTVSPFNKISTSWIAFSFGIVSIVGACGITVYAFSKGDKIVSRVYGFSIFKLGVSYLSAQMAISVILLVLCAFVAIPTWVAVVLGIIAIGFCLIGLIVADNTIDMIEAQEKKVEAKIKEMKAFTLNIGSVIAICKNSEFMPHLERLEEAFKYSDPVSSAQTEPLEENIKAEIGTLTTMVATNSENTVAKIQEIEALLSSRNALCKLTK